MAATRIHIVAADLGLTDDEVLDLCSSLGIEADAPSTLLSSSDVRRVKHTIARAKIEKIEEVERHKIEEKARKKTELESKKRAAAEKKRKAAELSKEAARKKKDEAARKNAETERKAREKDEKIRVEAERKVREAEEEKKAEEFKKREEARRQAAEEIRKRDAEEKEKRAEELKKKQKEEHDRELAKKKAEERAKLERFNRRKKELRIIELSKLITVKSLAPKFGLGASEMTEKLDELGLKVPQSSKLDKDAIAIFAGEIGYDVVFKGDIATDDDVEHAKQVDARVQEIIAREEEAQAAIKEEKAKKKKAPVEVRTKDAVAVKGEEETNEPEPVERKPLWEEEDNEPDKPNDLVSRAPIVTVMGHVDHGKTSILDFIRSSKVAEREKGGITQHIGAYKIDHQAHKIVFIDTPGHEAFTEMRIRGTKVTDIVIIVVAADDGIMPQTIEAINHAKSADVPIIVAINKIDRANATPDQAKQQLMQYNLLPEAWGGETIVCDVSAISGAGIEHLLEMINLQAEIMELKANPKRKMRGVVIESRISKGQGPVASIIVNRGSLKVGSVVVCGASYGKVKAFTDENGNRLKQAGPSTPVEIMGLSKPPPVGEVIFQVDNEKRARELASRYEQEEKVAAAGGSGATAFSLEDFLNEPATEEAKELKIVLKGDVQGTIEALSTSLEKAGTDKAQVKILHSAVGVVNESDVMLAMASEAIIIAFTVKADPKAVEMAERKGVKILYYDIIYRAIEEIRAVLEGLLEPVFNEIVVGEVEIRQLFKSSSMGTIAGCFVRSGVIARNLRVRILRESNKIWEGEISSLYRFHDEVKEVKNGMECGIRFRNFYGIEVGDFVESLKLERVAQTL